MLLNPQCFCCVVSADARGVPTVPVGYRTMRRFVSYAVLRSGTLLTIGRAVRVEGCAGGGPSVAAGETPAPGGSRTSRRELRLPPRGVFPAASTRGPRCDRGTRAHSRPQVPRHKHSRSPGATAPGSAPPRARARPVRPRTPRPRAPHPHARLRHHACWQRAPNPPSDSRRSPATALSRPPQSAGECSIPNRRRCRRHSPR